MNGEEREDVRKIEEDSTEIQRQCDRKIEIQLEKVLWNDRIGGRKERRNEEEKK